MIVLWSIKCTETVENKKPNMFSTLRHRLIEKLELGNVWLQIILLLINHLILSALFVCKKDEDQPDGKKYHRELHRANYFTIKTSRIHG